jgi:pantetheine-phosphate adenylyltransferase
MKRTAIYPGSFDPPTYGHMDIVERSSRLFDRLVIAVGVNSAKKSFLTTEQRVDVLSRATAHLPNVTVQSFQGLLVKYAESQGARTIVRGLRATADFEYEFQMAMVNRRLTEDIETMFLMTKWEHSYLSSSIVREVAVLGGDFSEMVPPVVAEVLRQVVSSPGE